MKPPNDRKAFTVRVTPRVHVVLRQLARQEKRSVSAQAAVLIEQALVGNREPVR
jgi:hypothetical protein